MKKRIGLYCTLCLLLSVCFCFLWQSADPDTDEASPKSQSIKSTGNAIGKAKEEKEKYYIHIDGDTICAYLVRGDDKILIKKSPLNTVSLPEGELEMLKEGIYAGSYEELCLYFESYIS